MSDDLVTRFTEFQDAIGGCTDGYCVIRRNRGQHTNGGCRCLDHMDHLGRQRVGHMLRVAQDMVPEITRLRERLAEAQMKSLADLGQAQEAWEAQKEALNERDRLREQLANSERDATRVVELLGEPEAVFGCIATGHIAKPPWDQIITLYPEAEAERQRDAARAEALDTAYGYADGNPARAWLLALLDALIGGGGDHFDTP